LEEIPKYTSDIEPEDVISAGALGFRKLTQSTVVLEGLRRAYAEAVSSTLYLATAAICLSIPVAACMQWLNLKKVSAQRMKDLEKMEGEKKLVAVREQAESEENATIPFANLNVSKATLP
jgi:hypothetical protein